MWCKNEEMGAWNVPTVQGGSVAWRMTSIVWAHFVHGFRLVMQATGNDMRRTNTFWSRHQHMGHGQHILWRTELDKGVLAFDLMFLHHKAIIGWDLVLTWTNWSHACTSCPPPPPHPTSWYWNRVGRWVGFIQLWCVLYFSFRNYNCFHSTLGKFKASFTLKMLGLEERGMKNWCMFVHHGVVI